MARNYIIVFCCLSCLTYSFSQDYNIERYTVFEGLPNSNIIPLFEDRLGYLWIGSLNGLARFDGKNFTSFSEFDAFSRGYITSITEDKHGHKLIASYGGLYKFDGKALTKISLDKELPEGSFIDHFAKINDSIFFLTSNAKLGLITADTIVWDIPVPISANRILSYDNKLMLYGQDQLLLYTKTKTESWSSKNRFSKLIKAINYGGTQLLSTDRGLYKIAGNEIVKSFPEINMRVALFSQADSTFWLAPYPPVSGLLQAKVSKSQITIKPLLNSTHRITYAIGDSEDNLWFATENKGIIKISRKSFTKVFDTPIAVTSIGRIEDQLWVGTMGDGIHILKNGRVKSVKKFKHPGQNVIRTIKEDGDFVWIGSNGGLMKIHKITGETTTWTRNEGLNSDSIYTLEVGPDKRLWIGTRGSGLASFDGKTFKQFRRSGSQKYYVWSMSFTENDLYIGTERGLFAVRNEMLREINVNGLRGPSVYSVRHFVHPDTLSSCKEDSTLLLLGTNTSGIVIPDPKGRSTKLIGKKDGLASNCIYNADVDRAGSIWLNTDHGIQRLRLDHDYNVAQSQVFNSDNGFDGIDSNITSRLFDNEIHFCSISGLYKFEDRSSVAKAHELHLVDVELNYGDREFKSSHNKFIGPFMMPDRPEFLHTENHLTFHFNRVNKFSPEAILYKFKLENFDNRWSNPSTINSVTYSNLPPGDYNLLVEATGPDGKWLKDKVEYEFKINPPFYRTTIFYFIGIVLLIAIVIGVFYLRLASSVKSAIALENLKAHENDRIRKELARDFHDEMGNKLSTIINYAALLRFREANQNADITRKVEDSAKELLHRTQDFIWSIDPINDEVNNLFIHIKDFGEKFFEEKPITFRAHMEVSINHRLPKGFSRQVNLIFKEAMTNAYKHSQASNVEFSLSECRDAIRFCLEDDGIGLELSLLDRLNGINNMRYRAAKINSKLKIDSIKGRTKIILEIELTKNPRYATNIEKTDTHYRG